MGINAVDIQPRRFLAVAGAVFFMLCLGAPSASWLFLKGVGELSLPAVIEAQAEDPACLFGSGIEQDNFTYKLELYKKLRPETVVIGSSRVMQMRGRYFSGSFVNLGGATGSTVAFAHFVDEMMRVALPKLAIIGVDFWWFNPAYARHKNKFVVPLEAYAVTVDRLKLPYYWLLEGKVGLKDMASMLAADREQCRFGIMAHQLSDGFASDGSYYQTSFVVGDRLPDQPHFDDELSRIGQGRDRFEWGDAVSRDDLERFSAAVGRLRSAGVDVVVFMPPLARPVYDAVMAGAERYRFLMELPDAFRQIGLNVYDYTNPASVPTDDCEFLDGFHGGEVTYARIVERLTEQEPKLRQATRARELRSVIETWAGYAMVANSAMTHKPEVDFLRMGCFKPLRPLG